MNEEDSVIDLSAQPLQFRLGAYSKEDLPAEQKDVQVTSCRSIFVASALARAATDMNFDRVCQYLDRMPTEFRVLSVSDATLREPAIRHTPPYIKWVIENHRVLTWGYVFTTIR